MEDIKHLQSLHRDLLQLNEFQFANVDRLLTELEYHIGDFQKLLDKRARNDKSRQTLSSGSIELDDVTYSVNEQFKQEVLQLAEILDLDEIEAAALYLKGETDSQSLDRSTLTSSVIIFHQKRQFTVECLRLLLEAAARFGDEEEDEARDYRTTEDKIGSSLKQAVGFVLQAREGAAISGAAYWRKCIAGMTDIEKWLQQIAERIHSVALTGQVPSVEFVELMTFQRDSLAKQHECLGSVACALTQENHTNIPDFQFLLKKLRTMDRYDASMIHYIPVLTSLVSQFAPSSNSSTDEEVTSLHDMIVTAKDQDAWASRNFQAAIKVLWLPEYSARFLNDDGSKRSDVKDFQNGATKRSVAFMEALRDGGFHFILSVCRDIMDNSWQDPMSSELINYLNSDSPGLVTDSFKTEKYFQDLVKLQLQTFVQSYITNMPDTLRQLRWEEDEQRKLMHGMPSMHPTEPELHLERFYIITAYAFEGMSESAENFWQHSEGNLFGFLQWASSRQSTPRVAAFCQMLRALADSETSADHAHNFLLGESTPMPMRYPQKNLSWSVIFSELDFYSSKIRDKPPPGISQAELIEPESGLMLECYLWLLGHLAIRSSKVRNWLIGHTFRVHEHLLSLCGSSIDPRLKACVFSALASLLTNKERDVRDAMWLHLDHWISQGGSIPANFPRPAQPHSTFQNNEELIFESLSNGFLELNAFVQLLQALISPSNNKPELSANLPFPESLGSAYRMPGIDPYVDFVLGKVFGGKISEVQDLVQLRLLRLNCLTFAETCLSTFNEALVMFPRRSNTPADSTSLSNPLPAYARLHPFSRVMEWFFNERVIAALFTAAEQNVKDINEAVVNSPLVLSVIKSIRVIDLVLTLQSTYFDVVRPLVKLHSASRRITVANSAIASFEDVLLSNIRIVTNLGMYCGTGHQGLAMVSIRLLQRLCSSRKLTGSLNSVDGRTAQKNRLIVAMEKNNEVESVSRSLIGLMRFDVGEISQGPTSPGIAIKSALLEFLNESISATSNRPTIAHLLLGFDCYASSLDINPQGLFIRGDSLFHAVVQFMIESPSTGPGTNLAWLSLVRNEAIKLLSKLWKSPLSARFVLPELRDREFLVAQWLQQPIISNDSLWDGRVIYDPDFFSSESARGYIEFLQHRSAFLDYVATEMKSAVSNGLTTLRNRIQSASLGMLAFSDGRKIHCSTIFDFFDFSRLELGDYLPLPESKYFTGIDFLVCQEDSRLATKYDVGHVEQLLLLRQNELHQSGQLNALVDEKQILADVDNMLQCFMANNIRGDILVAHIAALESWARLIVVFLECAEFEITQRNAFILQCVQLLLPHLERFLAENMTAAIILAQLGRGLLDRFDPTSSRDITSLAHDSTNDKPFQLFRLGLVCIQYPDAPTRLRETCYILCHRYLNQLTTKSARAADMKHVVQTIKSLGDRVIEVTCDDAYAGDGSCRTSALLVLGSIVIASNRLAAKAFVDSMSRLNFIQVMVDSIGSIPNDLRNTTNPSDLLSYYDASLALLLRIAQTRPGAAHVNSAGIFDSVHNSGLFDADPDIGLDVENPKALAAYFKLLLAIIRIINAIVLSRGAQNDQTSIQVHQFLQQHRSNIMAIFKRSAHIGMLGDKSSVAGENEVVLQELVDNFTLLITASDFLATEQQPARLAPGAHSYT